LRAANCGELYTTDDRTLGTAVTEDAVAEDAVAAVSTAAADADAALVKSVSTDAASALHSYQ